jgi:hypothetical protein
MRELTAQHGRGTAWARHAMCKLAFGLSPVIPSTIMRSSSIIAKFQMESLYILLSYNVLSTEHAQLITVDVYNKHAIPCALYHGIS